MKRLLCLALLAVGATASAGAQSSYLSPEELQGLVTQTTEPYILVDVRTPGEYATGHIPTAVNVPVDIIASEPPTTDKGALIIVYCRSGMRSARAKASLDGLGYTRVVDFGGISRWTGDLEKQAP